ncbi:integrase [Amycolatopsis sp. NPDC059090]|uniref:integrase n=1 Tax=unclassified Amycolatopsis TaxID=2618356 RepID=UPI003670385A
MTRPAEHRLPPSVFAPDEPVIQSHPLLTGAISPRFGQTDVWDFNGVVRRNANLPECGWRARFNKALDDPQWNLTARELAMIMANPRHDAVIDARVHLPPTPCDLGTVIGAVSRLRLLARWAQDNELPAQLRKWSATDLRRYITSRGNSGLTAGTVKNHILLIKRLHEIGPALSLGGPPTDPWRGISARKAADMPPPGHLSTPVIPPEIWFPLTKAAWRYVRAFAPDVLRASRRLAELRVALARPSSSRGNMHHLLEDYLADPTNPIPIHAKRYTVAHEQTSEAMVNWDVLRLFLGNRATDNLFARTSLGTQRRARVLDAVHAGHRTTTGLIDDLARTTRPDGTTGPWHPGLDPREIHRLLPKLRDAAFCLVAALSMMRDSEIHEICRGAVVDHFNAPAIASSLDKGHPGRPGKYWWITAPVAEAIAVAEAVSTHHERVFAPMKRSTDTAVHGDRMIDTFIGTVNADRDWTGLDEIPAGRVRPHMFRRTMAMLTDQFPGSEVALGLQLKHVAARALANRTTQSYAASDSSWATLLDSALEANRFRRFTDLYGMHKAGQQIGYGPGADRVKEAFDEILATVHARGGDARVETDLLRKSRITIRFGALNNCLFDPANPTGALCLENATIPDGHSGPLHERCRPDRCRNSMIGVEHLAIHDSHRRTHLKLLDTPSLPPARKALIRREIDQATTILDRAQGKNQ